MTYDIIPLGEKKKTNKYNFLRKPMPTEFPCRILACGPSGSGKTVAMLNVVLRHLVDKKITGRNLGRATDQVKDSIFNEIIVMSPSLYDDPAYEDLKNDKYIDSEIVSGFNYLDMEVITEIMQGNSDGENDEQTCLIIDDFAAQKKNLMQEQFLDMWFRSRHQNITLIFMTQKYCQAPTALRQNCNYMMLFRPSTQLEARQIRMDNETTEINGEGFDQMFQDLTKEKHAFMWVDKSDGKPKFFKNFEAEVVFKESIKTEDTSSSKEDITENQDA